MVCARVPSDRDDMHKPIVRNAKEPLAKAVPKVPDNIIDDRCTALVTSTHLILPNQGTCQGFSCNIFVAFLGYVGKPPDTIYSYVRSSIDVVFLY